MESCSRNDEGWIYCRGNQTIDADKALEKKNSCAKADNESA